MSFAQPLVLAALLLLPLYAWLRWRTVKAQAIPYAPLQMRDGKSWRARLLRWQTPAETVLLAVAVVALAGPYRQDEIDLVGEEGLDIALALDISASMQAADFPPSRLEVLKDLAADMVRRGGNDRVAVYAFGQHVFAQTPLTTDHSALTHLIEGLSFKTINHSESGGTALGDAILTAADGLLRQRLPDRDQVIVLISDGESNAGADPLLAARFAAENNFALYVVGVGGDVPVKVYVDGKPFITVADKILETQLDDTQLQEIAQTAGGSYFRAKDSNALAAIFEDFMRLDTSPLEIESVQVKRSYSPLLAVLIFLGFAAWLVVDGWWLRRPLR